MYSEDREEYEADLKAYCEANGHEYHRDTDEELAELRANSLALWSSLRVATSHA